MVDAPASLRFDTRDVIRAERRRALLTLLDQGLLPVEPLPDRIPTVELVKWRLAGASVLWGSFGGIRQIGEPGPGEAGHDLFFGINTSGASLARQCGRELSLGPGDALVVGLDAGRFTVLRPERSGLIGIRLPRGAVPFDGHDVHPPRGVPGHVAALQLLTRYLRSLVEGPVPTSPRLADAVVGHVIELIALSLHGPDPTALPAADHSIRAVRLQTIKTDIDRHVTDPALSATSVAARHGITPRYLHKLFEDEPMTYSQFVLDRRLDLAHRRLRDPRFTTWTVSAIAGDVGFGDLSYFNRTFRRHFHTTPGDVRHAPATSGADPPEQL